MAEQLAELAALAANPEPATVANVIEAWESSGQLLTRALNAFYTKQPADTNDRAGRGRRGDRARSSPRTATRSTSTARSTTGWPRSPSGVDAGEVELDPASAYWLERRLLAFERAGVNLPEADQATLRALNHRIAELQSAFGREALAGMNAGAVLVTDVGRAGRAERGRDRRRPGTGRRAAATDGWLIELDNTVGPASAGRADEPRRCASGSTGPRSSRGPGRRARHPGDRRRAGPAARASGPPCWASPTTPPTSPRTAAPAPARRSGTCSPGWRRRPWPTPATRPSTWSRCGAGSSRRRRWPPGTGSTSASCCAPSATRWTRPCCVPTWSWSGCCTTGVFAAANGLYGITFTERDDLVGYNPRGAGLRGRRRRRHPDRAVRRRLLHPSAASRAAPG